MAPLGRADGRRVTLALPFTALQPIELFAVEDTVAQFTWRGLPGGVLTVTADHGAGPETIELGDAAAPGAADVGGFQPGRATVADLAVDGRQITQVVVNTPESLGDAPLAKIATISDLHLGEDGFGLVRHLRERRDIDPYALRCARAAVREAQAWGADLLIIKGDITNLGRPAEWELFDELLADVHIPIMAVPGNHDTVNRRGSLNAVSELRRRNLCDEPVQRADIGGSRVVVADSTVPGHGFGRLGHRRPELIDAVDTIAPAFVFTHHHFEFAHTPRIWPLGVQRFDAARLVRELFETNPDLVISSGHTHRNRARRHATGLITEVSATKDFPGVWAGYTIHSAGVRQTVRRIADPSCVEWNDRTHAVVGGIWGQWSPGRLADRCVAHRWSRPIGPLTAETEVVSAR